MNKKYLIIGIVLMVVIGVGSFYGGMVYGQSKKISGQGNFQAMANGQKRTGAGTGQTGLVNGSIVSMDDKSITIKLSSGGSKIVFLSASTKVSKMADGALSDLQTGAGVMITGTSNQDGSVTAQSIQIRPIMQNQPSGTENKPIQ
ncbi:MAG: DUF5666 domain-containing protein [Candidatus Paceibacterota bacterium]